MYKKTYAAAILLSLLFVSYVLADEPTQAVQELQDISVTIKAGSSQGSGVLFTREHEGHSHTFVWTAAHVIASLR
jgi:hypothetical protein